MPADYDGDGKADIAVFRPSNGTWFISLSSGFYKIGGFIESRNQRTIRFGQIGDIPAAADYDGDGRADIALYRPSTGVWYFINSNTNVIAPLSIQSFQFGISEDIPEPADYDGDGKTDVGVYRPSIGAWFIWRSSDNRFQGVNFGVGSDIPVPADYNGDGRTDIAVYRRSNGGWYSLNIQTNSFSAVQFGAPGDRPLNRPNLL